MELYTLTMVLIEDDNVNDYERGVFTTLDKAKEGAEYLMKGCESENVPEIYISKVEPDVVEEPIGVMGWLKDENGKFFKYFDMVGDKAVAL